MEAAVAEKRRAEILRCMNDYKYFLQEYGYLMGKDEGGKTTQKIPFTLFKYQSDALDKIHTQRDNIFLKARQLGLSWTVAGYALWLAMFHKYQRILIVSINDTEAQVFLEKVKFIFDNLPEWMKVSVYKRNESVLWFGVRKGYDSDEVGGINSKIESIPTSKNAGSSRSLNLLIIDEAAKVEFIDAICKSAFPALAATAGKCVMLSTMTIESTGEYFEEMWHGAVNKSNTFAPFFIPFYKYPGHTEEWLVDQLSRMPASKRALAKQEHPRTPEEAFQIAGGRYFAVKELEGFYKARLCGPKRTGYLVELRDGVMEFRDDPAGDIHIRIEPQAFEDYIISADPAEGVEQDNTVITAIRKRDLAVCARFKSNITQPDEAARIAIKMAKFYNNGLIAAENNNQHGGAMNLELKNNYWNLFYHEIVDRDDAKPVTRWGFRTDGQTRTWILDHLDKTIRSHQADITDIELYEEIKEYIIDPKSGRGDHKKGRHDDYIFAVAIGYWVIRENPWFDKQKYAQQKKKHTPARPKGGY